MNYFRQNLDTINRLLKDPATTAMGGYSLGVISALAEQDGIVAPNVLLEAAARCQTIKAAVELYEQCAILRGKPLKYAPSGKHQRHERDYWKPRRDVR